MREEVKWFLTKSAPQLPGWSSAGTSYEGGTNAVTKLPFPVFSLSNKFIWRACQSCNLLFCENSVGTKRRPDDGSPRAKQA